MPHRPIVTLTTDFGTNDHFVGAVKGVILDIVPEAAIVDITHAVQAFDVLDGGTVIFGPAVRPLPQLPLAIDADGSVRAGGELSGFVGPDAWETPG